VERSGTTVVRIRPNPLYFAPSNSARRKSVTFETDRPDEHVGWQTHNLGDSGVLTLRADDLGLE
jgi:hypothetical protein